MDDFGNMYLAPIGGGVGTPGPGFALTRGMLDINYPSESDLITNLSGHNISLCGGYGIVACRSYTPRADPWNNTASQIGVGGRGANLTWSYAWPIGKLWIPCESRHLFYRKNPSS